MKKTILQSFIATVIVAFTLSSCLGDNNSKYETKESLAYIKSSEKTGGNFAVTNAQMFPFIASDYINKLSSRKFYLLGYNVSSKDGVTADNAAYAQNVTITGNGGYPLKEQFGYTSSAELTKRPLEVYPTTLGVIFRSVDNYLDDKWVFSYQCTVKEADAHAVEGIDNVRLVASYIDENQNIPNPDGSEGTTPLANDKIVINLHVEKIDNLAVESAKDVTYSSNGVIDLSGIRRIFSSRGVVPVEGKQIYGYIQFQYTALVNGVEKVTPIGNFTTDGGIVMLME